MSNTELMLKKFGNDCEARGEAKGTKEMLKFFEDGIAAMKEVTAEALAALLSAAAEKAQTICLAAEKIQTDSAIRI